MMCPSKKTHLKDMQMKPLVKVKQSSILFYSHSTYHCPAKKCLFWSFALIMKRLRNLTLATGKIGMKKYDVYLSRPRSAKNRRRHSTSNPPRMRHFIEAENALTD